MVGYNLNPEKRISGGKGKLESKKKYYVVRFKPGPYEILNNLLDFIKIMVFSFKIIIPPLLQSLRPTGNIIILCMNPDQLTQGKNTKHKH
jgi:hypothetical protein